MFGQQISQALLWKASDLSEFIIAVLVSVALHIQRFGQDGWLLDGYLNRLGFAPSTAAELLVKPDVLVASNQS